MGQSQNLKCTATFFFKFKYSLKPYFTKYKNNIFTKKKFINETVNKKIKCLNIIKLSWFAFLKQFCM